MTETLAGGCFCGTVRFEVEGPETFACFCHCRSCQRAAGAPVVAWATYLRNTFRLTHGEMQSIRSSPGVTRGFCARCGSSITYEHAKRGDDIDITVSCLDDPSAPALKAHIWTEDKQPWLTIGDDLPVYEKNSG
ncbi:MAG: GFA family protein [Gammaproteobacteria bacterium]|nr:GFA family protein [Gammaproteobacteria bacterium]NNF49470.1 GFA family protein [Woeseiaceae bacterium]MBT8093874.1 GFA family protein [Gammaproteobacteria bacterium]MBT8105935.1 GFA family protein [Gammaproteobacteria bacterium]NNK25949.1 GFA family protein [Woeseiaceae bacterium]